MYIVAPVPMVKHPVPKKFSTKSTLMFLIRKLPLLLMTAPPAVVVRALLRQTADVPRLPNACSKTIRPLLVQVCPQYLR